MALDLFKLLGTIEVDNSEANKSLDETSDKGSQTQSKLSKAFGAVGKGVAVVGKAIVTGLAAGGAAFAGLTAKALSASGELEQNMGGSEAVFKEYATRMQDTAKNAFSNMGLSTSDYLATANKMGALFQGAGFDIEESMNLSSDAMQRAADVASIMGIDTGAAMEAIAGAAKGNFTMMDNLGVAMNDTTLQAYALEKGINKSTTEMTNQEKIGLAMEMFMEKTAYAAGNYAKENETLAGSLGTAKSALTNFLDGSGSVEDLVSSFGNLANVAVKSLKEILPRLTTGLTEIVNQIMPMLPGLLQTILPSIVEGAVSLIDGLVSALPAILDVLTNSALPMLISGIGTIFESLISALPGLVESICSALPTLLPLLINGLVSMIVTLCTNFSQIIQPIITYLPQIIISVVDALVSNLPILIEGAVQLVVGIVSALPQIVMSLVQAMPTVIKSLVRGLVSAAPALIQGMKDIWNSVTSAVSTVFTGCKDKVVEIAGNIKDKAVEKFNHLKEKAGEIWGNIKEAASEKWNSLKSAVVEKVQSLKDSAVEKFNSLKSSASEKFSSIKTDVVNKITALKDGAVEKFNAVKSKATEIFNNVKSAITQPIEKARDTIKGIVDKIVGFFKGMKIEIPNIKLPHISISGKLSLSPPSVPKLSIEWYKKAMDNPMIMDTPTIFGYNPATNSYMGGGEAGSEVVSGTNTLMNMIRTAVAAQNDAVVYYLQKIIEILAEFFPQLIDEFDRFMPLDPDSAAAVLAVPMNKQLGKLSIQKGRGR